MCKGGGGGLDPWAWGVACEQLDDARIVPEDDLVDLDPLGRVHCALQHEDALVELQAQRGAGY